MQHRWTDHTQLLRFRLELDPAQGCRRARHARRASVRAVRAARPRHVVPPLLPVRRRDGGQLLGGVAELGRGLLQRKSTPLGQNGC